MQSFARALRDLEHDLFELGPAERACDGVDLVRRLARLVGSDLPLGCSVERDGGTLRLSHMCGHAPWNPRLEPAFERSLAAREPHAASFDLDRPAPWLRDVAHRSADLRRRGAPESALFAALEVEGLDRLGAMICEGRSLLLWVGAYRDRPFTERERRALTATLPAVRSRLLLERYFAAHSRAETMLTAALDGIGAPAFVLSRDMRVEEANLAGRMSLEKDRAAALDALRIAVSGAAPGRTGGAAVVAADAQGWLVILDAGERETKMSACIALISRRAGLTPQQTRVLALLADGLTNRGIAASLGLSTRTVESHVQAILDKVGVGSRAGVLAALLECGG